MAKPVKTPTNAACEPDGACATHGRCWTHSEWDDAAEEILQQKVNRAYGFKTPRDDADTERRVMGALAKYQQRRHPIMLEHAQPEGYYSEAVVYLAIILVFVGGILMGIGIAS